VNAASQLVFTAPAKNGVVGARTDAHTLTQPPRRDT